MADVQTVGLTWRDLDERYPELEHRELHDGVLVVSPAPGWWHQRIAGILFRAFSEWTDKHGGEVFFAPVDIVASDQRVYQPDVWLLLPGHLDRLGSDGRVHAPPDLVVEVSSPSTRWFDLGAKRDGYAALGVPEYWYADMGGRRVLVYRLVDGAYGPPEIVEASGTLTTPLLPGFALPVKLIFD
ncbi:MAG: Uma2 family endonuclease [Egibacteraceae bacterium]